MSSKKILTAKYTDDLRNIEPIIQTKEEHAKDYGTTARRPQQRVAAVTVGRNTYHFQGIAKNNVLTEQQDDQFKDIIASFRRATRADVPPDEVKTIYYKRLEPGETLAELAADKELGTFTEEYLRLMNGYYPKGEPEPGTWVKLVQTKPLVVDEEVADAKSGSAPQ